MNIKNNSQAST